MIKNNKAIFGLGDIGITTGRCKGHSFIEFRNQKPGKIGETTPQELKEYNINDGDIILEFQKKESGEAVAFAVLQMLLFAKNLDKHQLGMAKLNTLKERIEYFKNVYFEE